MCRVGYSRGRGVNSQWSLSPPTPTRVPSSVGDSDRHRLPTMPISFPCAQLISWMCSLVNGSSKSTQRCSGLSQGALIAPVSEQAKLPAWSRSAKPLSRPIPITLGPGEGSCSHLLGDNGPEQSCLSEQHHVQAGKKKKPQRLCALELTPRAGGRRNVISSAPRFTLCRGPSCEVG